VRLGPNWTSAENLAPIGFQSPDRPGRSESLHRLSYPGPHCIGINLFYFNFMDFLLTVQIV